jgi:hypothetical protein
MTGIQYAGLCSAAFGAIGTAVLFRYSYTFQPKEGGVFGSNALTEFNNRIDTENRCRGKWQKVGLALLCLSFLIQAVGVFL